MRCRSVCAEPKGVPACYVHKTFATEGFVPQNDGIMFNHTTSMCAPAQGRIPHIFIHATLLSGLFLVLCLFPPLVRAATGTPCHTITSSGMALPAQYGSPINFFAPIPSPMLTVTCDTLGVATAHVQSQNAETYIYQYGFQRIDGKWKRFTWTGSRTVGPWVMQNAEALVPEPTIDEGKIIAYVCQKVDGVWKCGCRDKVCAKAYWQVQTYSTTAFGAGAGTSDMSALLAGPLTGDPGVHRLSNYMVLPGTALTISGIGFSKTNNEILFNNASPIKNVSSPLGTVLTFSVPTSLKPGKYKVTVRADGKQLEGYDVLWVQEENAPVPTITGITPAQGKQGGTYTITGTGFSTAYNQISTTFSTIDNVVSKDGTTITFKYRPFEEEVKFRNMDGSDANYVQKVSVYVMTSGGTSNEATFNLEM